MKTVRILVVDDYEPWRRLVCAMVSARPDFEVIAEAENGVDAVGKARELRPDVILLDIGMPVLNGIEAARHIREVSPSSKIVVISEMRIAEIAEAAFASGVSGYVVKSAAMNELLTAVKAVLRGAPFASALLRGPTESPGIPRPGAEPGSLLGTRTRANQPAGHRHEAEFYPDDAALTAGFARRAAHSLMNGHAALIMVLERHREGLHASLRANGVEIDRIMERGDLYFLDAAEALGMIMSGNMPDETLVARLSDEFLAKAAIGRDGAKRRVSICGECAPTLLAEGNCEAAMRLERLWDDVSKSYDVDTLCGYVRGALGGREAHSIVQRICAEHSAVCGRDLVC